MKENIDKERLPRCDSFTPFLFMTIESSRSVLSIVVAISQTGLGYAMGVKCER